MFWISGSENGASPRKVSLHQIVLAPAAAPDAAVVAVRVGPAQASGQVLVARAGLVLRRRVRRDAAVLALHLVVEQAEVALSPACGASREMLNPSRLTIGITILRVALTSCVVRALAPVVGQQVVGELHRVLRRRPLTGVVDAQLQEDRLAVVRLRVLRDLDAVDSRP